MRSLSLALLLLLSLAPNARAGDSSALINEALDKLVNMELNTPLPRAMQDIAKKTNVPVTAAPAVWELLPWGEQTNINAKIENLTLREALEAITRKLGLIFVLKDESVELQPMPALTRLGRRSTVQELQALDLLASTRAKFTTERLTFGTLVEAIDSHLEALDQEAKTANRPLPGLSIENRPGSNVLQDQIVFVPRNATMMDALESITKDTRATWYPWGKSIVIVPKEDQVRNQLLKTVSVRYPGTDIASVITELSQKAGVHFEIEPGALQRVPPEFRKIKLDLYDASITKALEAIAGVTGLAYIVNERGVYIWNQSAQRSGVNGEAVIGLIPLDNGMQIMVPQSQLTPDMLEYLKARTERKLNDIRQMMKEEGFKPTTQPTTKKLGDGDL